MTYGIFSMESGTAIAWFDSAERAFSAVVQIAKSEPDAVPSLGFMEFDDAGKPVHALQGEELLNQASGVLA